ncbi:hypothetical protein M132_4101 [Bacteroides fragilis str. S24L15]|nr:hypothetical protein M073_3909 [Bacteroides fragilis str. DS-71]EXZ46927.1 hypothetical protein M109_4107 [Bacteroides fragilis str. 3397 N2]EXZ51757.1 hypothetical protein M108_4134 [Bacteroides fragilis str. 3397 T14]EXZ81153.1 hypothetical protein M069_4388 [Bacteroides fragilis str. B1 (UDC16-1)]EYA59626.1 hypothetical protein M070_4076 [Bacteroides fragilis str. A7 (UDC12-2)]EYA69162.1 hypothetical protein M132_4101 [Bacteroides fragilis str. S24L15]EYA73771.1 hypothetical protein M13
MGCGDRSRDIIVHSYVFLPFGNSGGIIRVPINVLFLNSHL